MFLSWAAGLPTKLTNHNLSWLHCTRFQLHICPILYSLSHFILLLNSNHNSNSNQKKGSHSTLFSPLRLDSSLTLWPITPYTIPLLSFGHLYFLSRSLLFPFKLLYMFCCFHSCPVSNSLLIKSMVHHTQSFGRFFCSLDNKILNIKYTVHESDACSLTPTIMSIECNAEILTVILCWFLSLEYIFLLLSQKKLALQAYFPVYSTF
jgi:hypothetical protein